MGKSIITGITTLIIFITLAFIGISVASIIAGENSGVTTEENYDQLTNEVVDEISTYLEIKDQKGRYYDINGEQRIERVALWISPLVSQDIDVSQLTIQINNGDDLKLLFYNGNAEDLDTNSIFNHKIWEKMDGSNFGFISIIDLDSSLVDYNTINDYSDNVYVVFKLPVDMTMVKNEKLTVALFPSTGITRTIILEAPLPINPVVTFE